MRRRPDVRWMALLASLGLHGAALAALVTTWDPVPAMTEPPALAVEWVRLSRIAPEPPPSVPIAAPPTAAPAKIRSKPVVARHPAAIASSHMPAAETADVPPPVLSGQGSAPPGLDQESGSAASAPVATSPGYRLGDALTPAPDYPWSARRRGVEGRVVVRLHVDAQGHPQAVELLESSGDSALDRAAVTTLRHWRLYPATAHGQPVDGQVVVPILFKLT